MRTYSFTDSTDHTVTYVDRKRWWWSLSLINPMLPLIGVFGFLATGQTFWLAVPLTLMFVVAPLLDWLFGEDQNNPPESLVPQLEEDRYYRVLTYLTVPLHYITFITVAVFVGTQTLPWWGFLTLTVAIGFADGFAINTGHELGHKRTDLETWLAKIVLAVPAYGHFWIEHNRGHHRDVATPDDPASARMGESIYRFARREIPGAFHRAWVIERERLKRKDLPVFSLQNEVLQSYLISVVLQLSLLIAFGWIMIPFLVIHNFFSWWVLTSANYIEHYGLLRAQQDNGKYERCQPHHSWNANHIYSNLLLFHLQRHSDHHANPTRRYQSLRHFEDLPSLPSGYYGMYLLAYVPSLWFKYMDAKLLALPHVQGDLNKINIDPGARNEILHKYGDKFASVS
ncbi:alkB1 [Symbiodinium necroappetens]|jgi:alkane 1-monooxygenase|uniref:AlkB1 protein n=1 Tax=Symbiodinium necroappetens TaxID=1628268 RepID=A0A812INQ9_9DINO|nr:alkane 1-monooxygenase [Pseudomonadales bacterium]CAE7149037.1 alkB1 [Symbiodinium necroappetens]